MMKSTLKAPSPALAHRLVQKNCSGGTGIEGIQLSPHGNTDQEIAGLGSQARHAAALTADDDDEH